MPPVYVYVDVTIPPHVQARALWHKLDSDPSELIAKQKDFAAMCYDTNSEQYKVWVYFCELEQAVRELKVELLQENIYTCQHP